MVDAAIPLNGYGVSHDVLWSYMLWIPEINFHTYVWAEFKDIEHELSPCGASDTKLDRGGGGGGGGGY